MSEITRGRIWFRTGAPRRLWGIQARGYAIHTGVLLPPAAGPARTVVLEAEGRQLLAVARRGYGKTVGQVLLTTGSPVPLPVNLDRPWSSSAGRALTASRRAQWQQTRRLLDSSLKAGKISTTVVARLETQARAALSAVVASFDHLEDTDLATDSHYWAHVIGEMVAGLFGCEAKRDGDQWFDVCRLSLMHLRVGMSPGFVARRLCSICDRDLSSFPPCEHTLGAEYLLIAAKLVDGSCSVCGNIECLVHDPGQTYFITAHARIREADRLDEISTVPRPRDPLARYEEIEIPARDIEHLVDHDTPDASLYCERCVAPCIGFTSAEEAVGLA